MLPFKSYLLFAYSKKAYIIFIGIIFGALAQLGECLRGTQEVVGSSPTCSITRNAYTSTCVGVLLFVIILIYSTSMSNCYQVFVSITLISYLTILWFTLSHLY